MTLNLPDSVVGNRSEALACVPLEVPQVDADGWRKPVDMRDKALEEMQKELSATRIERDWAKGRVAVLEARLEAIREAMVKR